MELTSVTAPFPNQQWSMVRGGLPIDRSPWNADQGSMMAYRGVNPGQGSMDLDNLGEINFSIAFLYSIL